MTIFAPALLDRSTATRAPVRSRRRVATAVQKAMVWPVFVLAGIAIGAGSVGAAAVADQCVDETYRWGGDVELGGSSPSSVVSYDTGVDVPASSGATLSVVGVSADGLDADGIAHALVVHVGGMRATAGAAIAGGRVVVSAPSPDVDPLVGSLRIVGVTVVVRRCAVVASAAVAPVVAVVAVVASTSTAPPASTAPQAPTARGDTSSSRVSLPATGSDEQRHALVGALALGAGAGLVSAGRRSSRAT